MISNFFKMLGSLTLFVIGALGIRGGLAPHTVTAKIQWVHYIGADLPEQDVFIELSSAHVDAPDPDFIGARAIFLPSVFRVEGKAALTPSMLAQPVYAADTIEPHDPFKLGPNPLGPYYEGDPLGFTLGQWLAARGSGSYALTDHEAELTLPFQSLVPEGHYALWCSRIGAALHYTENEKACGAADGSQNRFKADRQGNGNFHVSLKALPESTPAFTTVLVLTYERDSVSLDGDWGGYGLSSHVQLFYAFPVSANATGACGARSAC
jgi:hypothetical protein